MNHDILIATEKENDLLELLLSTGTYQVILRESGQEVLAYLKENTPALLILDAHLPDLSGIGITSRVKRIARLASVPVLLLVSAKATNTLEEAQKSRADEIVTKPLTGKDIRAIVARLLGRQTLSDNVASHDDF